MPRYNKMMQQGGGQGQMTPQQLRAKIIEKLMKEEGMSRAEAERAADQIMMKLQQRAQSGPGGQMTAQGGQGGQGGRQMMKKGGKMKKKKPKKSTSKYQNGGSTFGVQNGGRSPFS